MCFPAVISLFFIFFFWCSSLIFDHLSFCPKLQGLKKGSGLNSLSEASCRTSHSLVTAVHLKVIIGWMLNMVQSNFVLNKENSNQEKILSYSLTTLLKATKSLQIRYAQKWVLMENPLTAISVVCERCMLLKKWQASVLGIPTQSEQSQQHLQIPLCIKPLGAIGKYCSSGFFFRFLMLDSWI